VAIWLALGIALLTGAASAAAAPAQPIYLSVSERAELPFTREELLEAVSIRAPVAAMVDPTAFIVAVEATPEGVQVRSASRAETLSVEGRVGKEAARVVALVVVDLWREPVNAPAAPTTPAIVAPASSEGRLSIAVTAGNQLQLTNAWPDWELGASATVRRLRGRWLAAFQTGYSRATSTDDPVVRNTFAPPVVLHTVPVRLGLGRPWRYGTWAAGPLVRVYFARGSDSGPDTATSENGALPGAFAAASTRLGIGGPWALAFSVGLEVYPLTREIKRAGVELPPNRNRRFVYVLETNHFAPWLSAGIQWR
jgi:hypothetical protein